MKRVVFGSTEKDAGKTSVIIGIAKVLASSFGYIKPFGDRLLYRKKRLWDYDSALITQIFDLKGNPEDMSMGFEHAKLRYMYDNETRKSKLLEMASRAEEGKDVLYVEGGRKLTHGASLHLDAISVAKELGAKLLVVTCANEGSAVDDIAFIKRYVDTRDVDFEGVVINKVPDIEEFADAHMDSILEMDVDVLGLIPSAVELTHFSVNYLADRLFAKVVAGEEGLNQYARSILVGAASTDRTIRNLLSKKENTLMITSGDRSDLILAALESDPVGIILTNNILPPSNIISKASDRGVPLLLVQYDTYQTANMIDNMEPLITKNDSDKIELLAQMIGSCTKIEEIARLMS